MNDRKAFKNIVEALESHAESNPDKIAYEFLNRDKSIDYIVTVLSCLRIGRVPVPAYPPVSARDVENLKKNKVRC